MGALLILRFSDCIPHKTGREMKTQWNNDGSLTLTNGEGQSISLTAEEAASVGLTIRRSIDQSLAPSAGRDGHLRTIGIDELRLTTNGHQGILAVVLEHGQFQTAFAMDHDLASRLHEALGRKIQILASSSPRNVQ